MLSIAAWEKYPMNTHDTAAIVVVYNNQPATVKRCLMSLRESGLESIVVMDNASHQSYEGIAQASVAQYIRGSYNEGFAAAANRGATMHTTSSLLFVNPDAVISRQAYEAMQTYLDTHPQVAAVGCTLVTPHGNVEVSHGAPVTPWSVISRHFVHPKPPTHPVAVGWVSGAVLMVRRSSFEAVGGFDRHFFLYWEDVDLCRRLLQQGYTTVYLPTVSVMHSRGESLQGDTLRKTVYYDLSADRYFRRHSLYPVWVCLSLFRFFYRWVSPVVR